MSLIDENDFNLTLLVNSLNDSSYLPETPPKLISPRQDYISTFTSLIPLIMGMFIIFVVLVPIFLVSQRYYSHIHELKNRVTAKVIIGDFSNISW